MIKLGIKHKKLLLFPTENTTNALAETPVFIRAFTSVTYVSLCNMRYVDIFIHYKIYTLQSVSRHTVAIGVAALF